MKSQYSIHIDILNVCMRFIVAFSIMGFLLLALIKEPSYVWELLYLLPAVAIIFIIERYAKQAWVYFLLNIILVTAYVLIFYRLDIEVIFGVYIMIEVLFQFFYGRRKVKKNIFPLVFVFIVATYLFCKSSYEEVPALRVVFFYLGIAFILLYILNMYFLNFESFIEIHKDNTIAPLKQIKVSNNIYMGVFIYLSYLAMLISSQFSLKGLLDAIWGLIKPILKAFFGYLANLPKEPAGQKKVKEEVVNNYGSALIEEIPKKPSKILIAIGQFFYNFVIVASIAALILLFLYGIYRLYKYFYEKKFEPKKKEEKKEFITLYEDEELDSKDQEVITTKRRFLGFLFKSNNDKIRKHYYKAIVNNTKQKEKLRYLVPRQLSKYAFTQDNPIMKEETDQEKEARLTELYEKARYSNKECSKEEWHSVKNMLK